jgi:hypothetical protein
MTNQTLIQFLTVAVLVGALITLYRLNRQQTVDKSVVIVRDSEPDTVFVDPWRWDTSTRLFDWAPYYNYFPLAPGSWTSWNRGSWSRPSGSWGRGHHGGHGQGSSSGGHGHGSGGHGSGGHGHGSGGRGGHGSGHGGRRR